MIASRPVAKEQKRGDDIQQILNGTIKYSHRNDTLFHPSRMEESSRTTMKVFPSPVRYNLAEDNVTLFSEGEVPEGPREAQQRQKIKGGM